MRGQGKASIIPLSVAARMPDTKHLTLKVGENETLMAAADVIIGLSDNTGFTAKVGFDPS